MDNNRTRRLWLWIVWAAMAMVVLKGSYDMYWRLWYEWHGAYNGDSPVYWAMGRSIVNGLTVYVDLLEIKPPVIFLISALSYWLTDDMRIGHLIQGLVILGTTLVVLVPCTRYVQGATKDPRKALLALFCVAAALALGLYTGARSGEFQTESFGAFFACCFIAIVAWKRTHPTWKAGVLGGLFFGLAVMTKEPFVITCTLGALLLVKSRRECLFLVIVPGIVAAVFSLILLASLGGLEVYLTVYLDYLVNSRTQRFGSPWLRGFMFARTWKELGIHTVALALLLPSAWASWFALRTERWRVTDAKRLVIGSISAVGGLLWIGFVIGSEGVLPFVLPIILMAFGILALVSCAYDARERGMLGWHALLWLLAFYGVTYAGGLSGEFLGHHFVFAVPVYAGLLLACVEDLSLRSDQSSRAILAVLAVLAAGSVLLPKTIDAYAKLDDLHRYESEHRFRTLAKEMDDVLTACDEERYLMVGEPGTDIFGFTKHSPLGPGFFQYSVNMTEQYFFDGFVKNIQMANVIVQRKGIGRPLPDEIQAYIDQTFTYEPWPCAAPFLNEGKYIFLFRKGA